MTRILRTIKYLTLKNGTCMINFDIHKEDYFSNPMSFYLESNS